jgi:hypothetical protein
MAHIAFSLSDGSLVYLEEQGSPSVSGPELAGRLQNVVVSLDAALESVRKTAGSLVASIRSAMPEEPDELEIEFGLKGTLEVNGFLVAKAASDAHYKVRLTWKKTTGST